MTLQGKGIKLVVITGYRVCEGESDGETKVLQQLNRCMNKENDPQFHRREYLKDLAATIQKLQSEGMEILLCHDANQHINHSTMRRFYHLVGLSSIHQKCNNITHEEMVGTFRTGVSHMDHIMGICRVVEAATESKLYKPDEILISDHKIFIIKFNVAYLLKTILTPELSSKPINKNVEW